MNSRKKTDEAGSCRRAYTVAEVADMFGKNRSWVYRQIKKGKISAIIGYGVTLVSDREIKRLLGEDDEFGRPD